MIARWATILLILIGMAHPARGDGATAAQAYDGGDYATAYDEWMKLARTGDPEAQAAIANMYRIGEGRPVDLVEAATWYRRAALQGEAIAQANIGEMAQRGLGVPRDPIEAAAWFSIAADAGNIWAAGQRDDVLARLSDTQRRAVDGRIAALLRAIKKPVTMEPPKAERTNSR